MHFSFLRNLFLFLIFAVHADAGVRRSAYFEYTLSDQSAVFRAHDFYGQFTFENGISVGASGQKTKFFSDPSFEESGGSVSLRNSPMDDWIFSLYSTQAKAQNDYSKANTTGFVGYNFDYFTLQTGYSSGQHRFLTLANNEKSLAHTEVHFSGEFFYSSYSFFINRTNYRYSESDLNNIISPLLTDPSSLEYSGLATSVTIVGASYYVDRTGLEISRVQTAADDQETTNTWKLRASTELSPILRAAISLDDNKLVSLSLGLKIQL